MTREEYRKMYRDRHNSLEIKFFGENGKHNISGKYYNYRHVLDQDTIIINTNNVRRVKDSLVLVVDNDKAVYLKDWNVKQAHNWSDIGTDFWIVKLSRAYFRPYTFSRPFDDIAMDGVQDFDFLLQVAREQDEAGMPVANGFMG